ncbi:MAG: hypothetical protein HXX20_15055, partial [Chloroflexi bacterium]|nr:hypothetical protein [Chloroflexota bacterium]
GRKEKSTGGAASNQTGRKEKSTGGAASNQTGRKGKIGIDVDLPPIFKPCPYPVGNGSAH